jgi:tetratricopeptide (TPR) repeat protein
MKKSILLATACIFFSGAFAQAAEIPPVTSTSLYQQGQAAEKAGDPAAAQGFYEKSLKADPNNANARYSLGQIKIHGPRIAAKGREEKFGAVVIPVFQLNEASLQEALDALGVLVEKESKETAMPNFIIEDPQQKFAERRITLNLKGMPAKAVMKYLMDQSGAKARYDEHAVVVTAK